MSLTAKSNLKRILDERGIKIRQLVAMSDNKLKFETVRKLYNDDVKQYQRDTLGLVCETLNIKVEELLELVDKEADK
jgi:DNA-binding Xre family transcriptional regulator